MQMIRAMLAQHACGPHVRVLIETLQPQPGWSRKAVEGGGVPEGHRSSLDIVCSSPVRFHLLAQRSVCPPLSVEVFMSNPRIVAWCSFGAIQV